MALQNEIQALLFDVFGTCVDWRSTVTAALIKSCGEALSSPSAVVNETTIQNASKLSQQDWGRFAQEWRNTYKVFVKSIATDSSIKWKSVDEHHYDSLVDLMKSWSIEGLWSPDEIREISLIWHKLDPWSDSVKGMDYLNTKYQTATLSNGNMGLLEDLRVHSGIQFKHLFSADQFQSYKPSPKVYLGAVAKFGLQPNQCAMVAAHLGDLKAARSCGLRTIFVERPKEEDFDESQVEAAKRDGYVDLWISEIEPGFIAVAESLGIKVGSV
jgi:2-haloacid dehalogenase